MSPEEIVAAYTVDYRSMESIGRQARLKTDQVRALLVEAGITIRRAGVCTDAMAQAARLRAAATATRDENSWPSPEDHRRHIAAVYAACPWGFDVEAGRRALAGRGI